MLFFFQEKLIFRSSKLPKDYAFSFTSDFKELSLNTDDGAVLSGLHFKQPNPNGIILYCHGNTGAIDIWGMWAEKLSNRYNYDVLVWDYRGYGKSSGKRRQNVMLDDGLYFYNYCKEYFKEDEIIVFGRSLGGFFATHLAYNNQPQTLILESTPTSILEIAKREYPWLPSKLLLKFRFENDKNVQSISTPTYIIHGTKDGLVPYQNGEELFKLSGAETKKLITIAGGDHNDLETYESYFDALNNLLLED